LTHEQIVDQLRQIVATLQRIVSASGELADRVTTLESRSHELGPLTAIQGSLTLLLEQIQRQGEEQARLNADLNQRIEALETHLFPSERPGQT
jgi:K+-sensing histidine kinase KdpD